MYHKLICNPTAAVAETTKGKVRGYIYDDIYTFKGIPYAKAKRFQRPVSLEAWEGVKECTNYGFVCPLLETSKPNGEMLVPHRYWPMDEDCQNLNVFTPGLDDKKRPVMVWLHGGGFEAGSAVEHQAYEGGNAAKYGDMVMVTINHRLNILGYLDLSAFGEEYENSGNAGTDDIIAALRWVQDNIASFGGDPFNVTVFGQSGGGAKVTTLLQSPDADGLFAKGINMSGVVGPILADYTGDSEALVKDIMKEAKVESVKELETLDYHDFAKAFLKVKAEYMKAGKFVNLTPHPNKYYAGDPLKCGWREETKDIPLMVGSVFGEFFAFAPWPIPRDSAEEQVTAVYAEMIGKEPAESVMAAFKKAYPDRLPADLLKLDGVFRGPEIPYIASRSALNNVTWSYLFNKDFDIDGGKAPWHCSDIPYFFHNCEMAPYAQMEGVEELEDMIFTTVKAFAASSNPNNAKIPQWDPCKPGQENTLILNDVASIAINFDHDLQKVYGEKVGPVLGQMMAKMMDGVQH